MTVIPFVVFGIQSFFSLFSFYGNIRYGDVQPLKARFPFRIILTGIFIMINTFSLIMPLIWDTQLACGIAQFIYFVSEQCTGSGYVFLGISVFVQFKATSQKLRSPMSRKSSTSSSRGLHELAEEDHLLSTQMKLVHSNKFILLLYLIFMGSGTLISFLVWSTSEDQCDHRALMIITTAFAGMVALALIPISRKFDQIADAFWIKDEFRSMIFALALCCAWGVVALFMESYEFFVVGTIIFFIIAINIAFTYPYYLAMRQFAYDLPKELLNFENFLNSPLAVQYFERFLVKEFSVENILFWREVNDYRKSFEPGQPAEPQAEVKSTAELVLQQKKAAFRHARDIVTRFVAEGALCQVNLPDQMAQKLTSKFKDASDPDKKPELIDQIDPNMFDEAQNEVVQLMERDPFKRFVKHTLCLELSKALLG